MNRSFGIVLLALIFAGSFLVWQKFTPKTSKGEVYCPSFFGGCNISYGLIGERYRSVGITYYASLPASFYDNVLSMSEKEFPRSVPVVEIGINLSASGAKGIVDMAEGRVTRVFGDDVLVREVRTIGKISSRGAKGLRRFVFVPGLTEQRFRDAIPSLVEPL